MNPLTLDSHGLNTEAMLYSAPTSAEKIDAVLKIHSAWTSDPKSPVYSGYRRSLLAHEGVKESLALSKDLRERFDTLFVLGIGGSALGARTALVALEHTVPAAERRRVFIADNLDPVEFERQWSACDPKRTAVVIISKSGGTIETMAQASLALHRFQKAGLDPNKHLVAITDPVAGALHGWAKESRIPTLTVPPDVGGRFSVLTPVGLLPLAFAGIDIEALCQGAIDQLNEKAGISLSDVARIGRRFTELEAQGFVAHNVMPYATILREFGQWFVQLWGESLGKKRRSAPAVGTIPMSSVGATDQHSLLQMLVEGPNRIVTGFLRVEKWPSSADNVRMEPLPAAFSSLSFAKGKTFAQILNAEQHATKEVLIQGGRPVYEIKLQEISARSIGALFAFYMDLTVCTAAAYANINPFDQPGVELGKKILPRILS